jgi:hypothetical protein
MYQAQQAAMWAERICIEQEAAGPASMSIRPRHTQAPRHNYPHHLQLPSGISVARDKVHSLKIQIEEERKQKQAAQKSVANLKEKLAIIKR